MRLRNPPRVSWASTATRTAGRVVVVLTAALAGGGWTYELCRPSLFEVGCAFLGAGRPRRALGMPEATHTRCDHFAYS
jgi:hypothetical protein